MAVSLIWSKCRNSFMFKFISLVKELCCVDVSCSYLRRLEGKKYSYCGGLSESLIC